MALPVPTLTRLLTASSRAAEPVSRPRGFRRPAILGGVALALSLTLLGPVLPAGAASKSSKTSKSSSSKSSSSSSVRGIDVSAHQHPGEAAIDWQAVRNSGIRFAYVKATEGGTYTNSWFARDWSGARKAGVLRGAYHYARPRYPLSSAVADARRFASTVQATRYWGDLAPALDLEETGSIGTKNLQTWVDSWMREVQRLTGRRPIIYTGAGFWNQAMGGTSRYRGDSLWVANYTRAARPTMLPTGWGSWTFWQFTDGGRVPGISTSVDVSFACSVPGRNPGNNTTGPCTASPSATVTTSSKTGSTSSKSTSSKSTSSKSKSSKTSSTSSTKKASTKATPVSTTSKTSKTSTSTKR